MAQSPHQHNKVGSSSTNLPRPRLVSLEHVNHPQQDRFSSCNDESTTVYTATNQVSTAPVHYASGASQQALPLPEAIRRFSDEVRARDMKHRRRCEALKRAREAELNEKRRKDMENRKKRMLELEGLEERVARSQLRSAAFSVMFDHMYLDQILRTKAFLKQRQEEEEMAEELYGNESDGYESDGYESDGYNSDGYVYESDGYEMDGYETV